MAAERKYWARLTSHAVMLAAVISLLTGCGEHGFTESSSDSVKEAEAKANSTGQCFFAGRGLDEKDMKLFAAAGADDVLQAEQLIESGAQPNAADSLKRTPLFAAVFCNRPQAINLIVDKGGDINARDFDGMSPLHAAVIVGATDASMALIAKGANLDIRNAAGRTPLHLAAATNQLAMVELLLSHGANAQARDKNGNAAAFLASDNGHATVAVTLRKWQEKQRAQSRKHD